MICRSNLEAGDEQCTARTKNVLRRLQMTQMEIKR